MRQINLLPWREARRKQRLLEFGIMGGTGLLSALLIVGGVHLVFALQIEYQQARNNYLHTEIAKQRRIEREMKKMEKAKAALLGRMEIIQNLQERRPEMVHVLDEAVRLLPEDVFLSSMKRSGKTVSLHGVARSNNHVSELMRNLEESSWFGVPSLNVVNNRDMDDVRASVFDLRVAKKRMKADEAQGLEESPAEKLDESPAADAEAMTDDRRGGVS